MENKKEPTMPKEDKVMECASCGYTTALRNYKYGFDPKTKKEKDIDLCGLCAGTLAGNAAQYPDLYQEAEILKTICYVGNVIIDSIKTRRIEDAQGR